MIKHQLLRKMNSVRLQVMFLLYLLTIFFINESFSYHLGVYQEAKSVEENFRRVLNYSKYEEFDDIEESDESSDEDNSYDSNELEDHDGGNGIRNQSRQWPRIGNSIEIPYKIDKASKFTKKQKTNILEAIREVQSKTCISFIERTSQINFITFKSQRSK